MSTRTVKGKSSYITVVDEPVPFQYEWTPDCMAKPTACVTMPNTIGRAERIIDLENLYCKKANSLVPKQGTEQKKEDPMYTEVNLNTTTTNLPAVQTRYLLDRVDNVRFIKEASPDLRKAFNLEDDDRPKTQKDFEARLAAGQYVINWPKNLDEEDDDYGYFDPLEHFRWRDPSKKEDYVGFEAARKAISTEAQKVKDTVMVSAPVDGLAALREFQSKTFH